MKAHNLHIYNTASRKKEKFEPINPPYVGMYSCGPTVYSDVHLGNVRTFLSFDLMYRYLMHLGYKVRYVRNITDVGHLVDDVDEGEDKIAKRARIEHLEPMEIVQKYTNGFQAVMSLFNILKPSIEPTATGHIIEQIEMIRKIFDNGYAYEVNGSVYFDVLKYAEKENYGGLSGRKIDELIDNSRELTGSEEKKNQVDFALWKKAEKNHLMHWPSPWGEGFPGWHLECSVMSTKYLGEQFDIHGGGMDLKFPHHECEIAQNKAALGVDSVKYWVHGNMLTVNGRKMSKSEGNGFTPEELVTGNHQLLEQGYSPMTVRFFMLQSHYTSTLDFSNDALRAAEKGYKKLMNAWETLSQLKPVSENNFDVKSWIKNSYDVMDDDFNSPMLIAQLFEAVKAINSAKEGNVEINAENLELLKNALSAFIFEILGFKIEETASSDLSNDLMDFIIELREDAKISKNYELSDKIRNTLKSIGIQLRDTKGGATWEFEG